VSGWGRIDVLHVAARGPDDTVVDVASTPGPGPASPSRASGWPSRRQRGRPPRLRLGGRARRPVLGLAPYDPAGSLGTSLRVNRSLALGVARRCLPPLIVDQIIVYM
jgi:hypothetical protein